MKHSKLEDKLTAICLTIATRTEILLKVATTMDSIGTRPTHVYIYHHVVLTRNILIRVISYNDVL